MEQEKKKPYTCKICSKEFALSLTHTAHMLLHERESLQKCSWCGELLARNSDALKDHMRNHLDEWDRSKRQRRKREKPPSADKMFSCPCCFTKLSSYHDLVRHIRELHEFQKISDPCDGKNMSGESASIRDGEEHEEPKTSYDCRFREDRFDTRTMLERHVQEHKNEHYQCEDCGMSCLTKEILENHAESHECSKTSSHSKIRDAANASDKPPDHEVAKVNVQGKSNADGEEKSHTCSTDKRAKVILQTKSEDMVGVSVSPEKNLISAAVEKNNGYACSSCGVRVASLRSVTNHMLVHVDMSLHSCKVCGLAFTKKNTLEIHEREHLSFEELELKEKSLDVLKSNVSY